jgi:DNA-binding MarR family transcriptional regulator
MNGEQMSRVQRNHEELLAAHVRAGRHYSAAVVLFHQAIADWFGLNVTDLQCLDLVDEEGEITPGKLAELSGLTTGAITGVVDRLEKGGYVRRERDLNDRRKIIIRPIRERIEPKLTPIFESFQQAMSMEFGSLYTDQDLMLLLDFMERSIRVLQAEMKKLRAKAAQGEMIEQQHFRGKEIS